MNKSCHEYLGEASSPLIPVPRELQRWKSLRWVSSQHWAGRPDWKELLLSRGPHKTASGWGVWGRELMVRTSNGSTFILVHWRRRCWPVPQGRQPSFPSDQLWVSEAFSLSPPSTFHVPALCDRKYSASTLHITVTSNELHGSWKHPHTFSNLSFRTLLCLSQVPAGSRTNIHSLMQGSSKLRRELSNSTYNHTSQTQEEFQGEASLS